jgi:predicted SnoaL-like aldol condensation-catalyzing enzyme
MNKPGKEPTIKLDDEDKFISNYSYFNFSLTKKFILHNENVETGEATIRFYSTEDNDKWTREKIYTKPKDIKYVSVSTNDDKVYVLSDKYIYEWSDAKTPAKRIFAIEDKDIVIPYLNLYLFLKTI